MKKLWLLAIAACLGGCATDSNGALGVNSIGGSLVKAAVDNQCRTELNKRSEWRMISLAMTAEKQSEWEGKICGCASEEAPNQMTAGDLMQIANPETRTQTVAQVTAKTVSACVKRLYH